jgi:hypothetical protein
MWLEVHIITAAPQRDSAAKHKQLSGQYINGKIIMNVYMYFYVCAVLVLVLELISISIMHS